MYKRTLGSDDLVRKKEQYGQKHDRGDLLGFVGKQH